MSIKSLYKGYFQKSKVFLYPVLGIKRGASVTPLNSYVQWEPYYQTSDRKLILPYHLRDDEDFIRFEKSKLLGNSLFHDFKQVDDEEGIYVFDLQVLGTDYDLFLEGKYSEFSAEHKRRIKNFYGSYDKNFPYVESFLEPAKYYRIYSDILNVKVDLLKEVVELCDKPDLKRESLIIDIQTITLKQETL